MATSGSKQKTVSSRSTHDAPNNAISLYASIIQPYNYFTEFFHAYSPDLSNANHLTRRFSSSAIDFVCLAD
jgi:hypothetical protein